MPYQSDKQRGYMHAQHPEIASRWDQEIRNKRKKGSRVSKAQPRYGGAGTRGRRINDDDSPIGDVAKRDTRSGSQKVSDRARSAAEIGGLTALATGATREGREQAREIVRDTAGNDTRYLKGKPFKQKVATRGQAALIDTLVRPKGAALLGGGALLATAAPVAVGARLKANRDAALGKAERFPLPPAGNWLKTDTQKAAYGRMQRRRTKVNPKPAEEVGKKARYYDPEHKRQRRLGAGEAVLVGAGGVAAGEGSRRVYTDTRDMRAKLKARPGTSGAVRLQKIPLSLILGGAGAITAAGALHRHAGSNRGAPYR